MFMPEYKVPWWLRVLRWFGLCQIKVGPFESMALPHIRVKAPKIDAKAIMDDPWPYSRQLRKFFSRCLHRTKKESG